MSQENEILCYLKSGQSLSPLEALEMFGCFRLASRIHNLKKQGHVIEKEIVERKGKAHASYFIR